MPVCYGRDKLGNVNTIGVGFCFLVEKVIQADGKFTQYKVIEVKEVSPIP